MSIEHHKVGTTLRDYFLYLSPTAGTAVTGLVQADFTIKLAKNGTGNQASTGITITEVDSTNNPGLYEVEVSGATGFVSATGHYELTIYRTADGLDDGVSRTWVVTSDGTGAGSWGDASFTSSDGDGRVTDGTDAIEGATVRIVDANGNLYVQTTTDASGDYGPIYFETAGTYTVYVQKANYTTDSDTITVSGSTATGPGANIALTAASNTSGILASSLWAYALRMYGDHQGAKADTEKMEIVNDALSWLTNEDDWPYMHRFGVIDFNAAYTTGTIAITSGTATVTLTGGTWPTWAASGDIYLNGQSYRVSTRTSATVLTLAETFNGDDVSGSSYTLAQHRYALPSDLLRIDQIYQGNTWPWGDGAVSPGQLELIRNAYLTGQQAASAWCIRKNFIEVWPYPTAKRRVNLLYWARPAELNDAADEADWDAQHLMLLRRAIDYQVALRGDCVAGSAKQCLENLQAAMAIARPRDKTQRSRSRAPRLGPFASSTLLQDIQTS